MTLQEAQEPIEELSTRVEALERGIQALEDTPAMGGWDLLIRGGGVLAVILTVLRIRDHFASRARVTVAVSSARFLLSYAHAGKPWEHLASPPEGNEGVIARTSIEVDLEVRNIGRAATTLSSVTLQTKHTLIGTQEMRRMTGDCLLVPVNALRIEPNDIQRINVHALLDGAPEEESIPGKLLVSFVHGRKLHGLTLKRESR